MLKKCGEFQVPFCLAFIDYSKAFDCNETASVFDALNKFGLNSEYVNLLENLSSGCASNIKRRHNSTKIIHCGTWGPLQLPGRSDQLMASIWRVYSLPTTVLFLPRTSKKGKPRWNSTMREPWESDWKSISRKRSGCATDSATKVTTE